MSSLTGRGVIADYDFLLLVVLSGAGVWLMLSADGVNFIGWWGLISLRYQKLPLRLFRRRKQLIVFQNVNASANLHCFSCFISFRQPLWEDSGTLLLTVLEGILFGAKFCTCLQVSHFRVRRASILDFDNTFRRCRHQVNLSSGFHRLTNWFLIFHTLVVIFIGKNKIAIRLHYADGWSELVSRVDWPNCILISYRHFPNAEDWLEGVIVIMDQVSCPLL